jgi:rSAM/selenodomain-associated transferase 2
MKDPLISDVVRISVIVPVLREEAGINRIIAHIRAIASAGTEIIIADGDPAGSTLAVISDASVIKVQSPKGRGIQQNQGAAEAAGEILLFLHADTELPHQAFTRIAEAMSHGPSAAGAFDLGIASQRLAFRIIERISSLRSRLTRIPYGDQAIFIRKSVFDAIGGFREFPVMEDVALMRDLKRRAYPIVFIDDRVSTSPRRWERDGIIRCTLRNWLLISLYLLGVSPERLARFYRAA